jgi:Family of unknown function (DUF6152)
VRRKFLIFLTLGGMLMSCGAAFAHHGSRVSYDMKKMVSLTGTVTAFQWQNPHIYIVFDVKDDNGVVTSWAAESYSPVVMTRSGWDHRTLKTGDKVTITLWPSKIGTPRGFLAKVVHPDGHVTDLTTRGGPE